MTEDGVPAPVDRDDVYRMIREQISHEMLALKEQIEAQGGITAAKFEAMDKAVTLLEKFPTAIDIAVGNLQALHEEKFVGVGVRFNELNTRLTEGDRYKQTALDAALKAPQTLVDKQQENSKETLKKTEELFGKQIDALQETVDDLKGMVRGQSGEKSGIIEARSSQQTLNSNTFSIITLLIAAGALAYTIFHQPTPIIIQAPSATVQPEAEHK